MLSIHSGPSVGWPTAPPPPAVPVQPVPAVDAAQPSRDAQQPDADSGHPGSSRGGTGATVTLRSGPPAPGGAPGVEPAPLLPRESADGEAPTSADEAAQARDEREQRTAEEQRAREKAGQRVPLQDVIVSVWKASAAVVDGVLGRDAGEGGEAASATLAQQAAVQAELPGIEPLPAGLRREQELQAYTEQGASSWAPMEAGSLISRRV